MIKNRIGRWNKTMLATLIAAGFACAVGCQSSPEPADDPIPAEPMEQPAESTEQPAEPAEQPAENYGEPNTEEAPPMDAMDPQAAGDLPESSEDVSEEQVEAFADAYVRVMDIRMVYEPQFEAAADAEEMAVLQEEAEGEIVEAVETQDLSIDEFNTIADLLAYDEVLRERVQSRVDTIEN